jgi:uncharacterized membrane protein
MGINDTNPSAKLSIIDPNTTGTLIALRTKGVSTGLNWSGRIVAGGNNANFLMGEYNGKAWLGAHNGLLNAWEDIHINPDGTKKLFLGSYPSVGNSIMMLNNATGNVGIGVTDPTASVEINASGSKPIISGQATDGSLSLQRMNGTRVSPTVIVTNNYLGVLQFKGQYSTTVGQVVTGAGIAAIASGPWSSATVHPTLLSFTVSPASGAEFEAMRIHPDGNLSIGNSTSSEKLSVTGNIKVTGNINNKIDSINTGYIQTRYIKELNLKTLNEEVTIHTVDANKAALVGDYAPNVTVWVHEHTGTFNTTGVITCYYTQNGSPTEASATVSIPNGEATAQFTLLQALKPGTTLRVKVTTATTGSTTCKVGISTVITN